MCEEPDNIVLRYSRRIDDKVDVLTAEVREFKVELRTIKTHRAADLLTEIVQDCAIARLQDSLDRIERRLDITEEPR